MNFYWFKLDLARLKLIDIPNARYIYFIFLNPRTDYDLLKEIYFIHFCLKFRFLQILQYLLKYSNNQNNSENAKGIKGLWACFGPGAAAHRLAGSAGPWQKGLLGTTHHCGCSSEGTLPAMGGWAMETTWRRITGHLRFTVSRREEGEAATRGKGRPHRVRAAAKA
jgi:hypothetical protein